MTLLAALVHMVLAVRELVPARARDEWFAFLPEGESAHSAHWDMYPPLSFGWIFPCTQEFPEDQPLRDSFLLADHVTLQRIARPALHALAAFLAKGRVYDDTDIDRVVQLFDDAIAPENTIFRAIANEYRAGRLSAHITHAFFNSVRDLIDYLPTDRRNPAWTTDLIPMDPASASLLIPVWFTIPRGPHEDSLEEPYPVQGMSAFDSVWHWWRRIQVGSSQPVANSPLRRSGSASPRAGTYSPHYEPSTPPERSLTPLLRPATPPAQLGPSAVGSASFDIRQLLGSARKDPPTPRKASAIAASPESPTEMQVDLPEMSSADAIAIAEALDDLPPRRGPPRTAARGRQAPRRGAPPVHPAPASLQDKKGRPMIKIKSSQKSVTPPASEAYNEEGEEEKDEEEEEEEEEVPPRPAKRRRTAPAPPKSKTPGKSKGKGKAQVVTPALPDLSTSFPIPVRKTRGKSKKTELPAYVPPQPVPLMDTVSLAAETVASQRREPLVFDAGCANCILRDRECDHGAPRSLCEHCEKGRLSHCTHNFSVVDHARAANHLEPYTRLSNERGNELITDLSAARADYELAREQLFRASARTTAFFNTMIPAIARDKSLYDVFFNMKNSYHQTATGPGGIIGGRYPTILDLCSRIKTERELNRVGLSAATIAAQQAHRTELEDARKSKKSKAIVEDIDDDVSVFDDSEFPMTGSGEVDDPMQIDAERVEEGTPSTSHRTTQSLDAHASVSPPDYEGFFKKFAQLLNNSGPVTADFPVPPPRKRNRTQSYAHEDSADQYAAAELATNGPAVQKTIAEVHQILSTDQSDTDSIGLGSATAQLRYLLEHREYLLKDLSRILDAQHQRTPAASSA
ncbi:hypothetical protein DFH08DRAFT_810088 [Mycena albidolilacea]|uniref:Zn(2)-C6 fungal-type domain-containing protein n=1 Tax=Mycena albidolilacea TaxID=1033008 RepID=A0AAD6ZYW9_9AGAR|nr:hypothetical protein DFH08DRAFT_810088 [Mycena albidolilacea]